MFDFTSSPWATYLSAFAAFLIGYRLFSLFTAPKKWSPKGQHCYVTGGSSGLGLSTAIKLTKAGAHVSIVARDEVKLASALASLEEARISPDQVLKSYSFPLNSASSSAAAIDAASEAHGGRVPDVFFLCAGASKPMFYLEMTEEDLTQGMSNGFWVQAWSAKAAAKKLVQQDVKGRIVFVGSILSYMSIIGYASYSPAKFALRGLTEALRSELQLYGIKVQMYFPNTILTPGFDEENKTKPAITTKIEEGDQPSTADEASAVLLAGVRKGDINISGDLLTSLFRASNRGATPRANFLLDAVYDLIAFIGVPIWRSATDTLVRSHAEEHKAYLRQKKII